MAYWVDDGIDTWPESIRAGTAALGLYLRCGAWISREIGGGRIAEAVVPVEVAAMYGSKEWITRLCDVGLWEHVADGYADCRYHQMGNPTAAQVAAKKAAKKARQERWLEKTRQRRSGDASRDVSRDDAPSLPPLKGKGRAPTTKAPPPTVTAAPKCKGFDDDGHGWCNSCRLPRAHKIHFRRAS